MMASIPNMRSTPLPVPTAKAAPNGDAAGDFAAQMPAPRGKPVQPDQPNVPQVAPPPAEGELTPLDIADVISGEDGEGETPRLATKAGAPEGGLEIQMAAVMPFVPPPQVAPGPPAPLTVPAEETPPAQAAETNVQPPRGAPVQATPVGRRSCGTGTGKGGEPAADLPGDGEDTPLPRELEAAVKELLQRKQVAARQVAAAPQAVATDAGKADAATPQAQAQVPPAQTPAAPRAIQAAAVAPLPDLPQPAPIPATPQLLPLASKAGAPDGTRTTDLAVERQLDLARDTEWLDRLARDIARAGANDQPLRFRLHPQTLGHMQVELQQGDHGTAVRLTVETEAARQILADAQPRLTAEARAQGVRIAETHVDLSGSGRHAPGDQRRQDEASQTPFIRTARGAGEDAIASARATGRARLDRYA